MHIFVFVHIKYLECRLNVFAYRNVVCLQHVSLCNLCISALRLQPEGEGRAEGI